MTSLGVRVVGGGQWVERQGVVVRGGLIVLRSLSVCEWGEHDLQGQKTGVQELYWTRMEPKCE